MICPGGNFQQINRLRNSSGALVDIPSGYYSQYFPDPRDTRNGKLTPLTTVQVASFACTCIDSSCGWEHDRMKSSSANVAVRTLAGFRETFCNGLMDSAGNKVLNLPSVCGGSGPEVLNYNPIVAALDYASDEGAALKAQYEAITSAKVKKITTGGFAIAALFLILGLIYVFAR